LRSGVSAQRYYHLLFLEFLENLVMHEMMSKHLPGWSHPY